LHAYYCWEKSLDGINWLSTGVCGTKTPVLVNGMWQYVVDTSFINVAADSGTYYRVKVATTQQNLSDASCSIDNSQKIFLKVYDNSCTVLETNTLVFTGRSLNDKAILQWTNSKEKNVKAYSIEKSIDGKNFSTVGAVNSHADKPDYKFEDPHKIEGKVFYRLKVHADNSFQFLYSNTISLSGDISFNLSVSNPFTGSIKLQTTTLQKGTLETELYDPWGKLISTNKFVVNKGLNNNLLDGLEHIATGFYFLRLKLDGKSIERKLIKTY